MNYKLKAALKRNRISFIVIAILWVIITIVFVAPLACTIVEATNTGKLDFAIFLEKLPTYITSPFSAVGKSFSDNYIGTFGNTLLSFTVFYFIVCIIGIIRAMPKNEYTDIEHGSSAWCEHGEQYKLLSKTKGILLAEDHYLPVDKRGNINVLVVGRFRFW